MFWAEITEQASVARERLTALSLDQAPVRAKGRPTGWVQTTRLATGLSVGECMVPLGRTALISENASVGEVLHPVQSGFLYTVGRADFRASSCRLI